MPQPAVPPQEPMLEYRSVLNYNRDIFLLKYTELYHASFTIDRNFNVLTSIVKAGRLKNGKNWVGLIPFLLLLQRQFRSAVEHLASCQSYSAWALLRPGLEVALIMGKWIDDPQTAQVWRNRREDPKAYRSHYWGIKLRSSSLPRSTAIQEVLSRISDDFLHSNPDYFHRHVRLFGDGKEATFQVNYFDDDIDQEAHAYALLHLVVVLQDAIQKMFERTFVNVTESIAGVRDFETTFRTRVESFVARNPGQEAVLTRLGLWETRSN